MSYDPANPPAIPPAGCGILSGFDPHRPASIGQNNPGPANLKTSFIIFLLPPHHHNFNKRLIKSPKVFFYDTGLACFLLGIKDASILPTHPLRGALFENHIAAEAVKTFHHHRQKPPVYFWRDRTGREIDLLLDMNNTLFPVEIKSGQTIDADAFDNLTWWSRTAEQPVSNAILIYGGDQRHTRHDIAVRPWYAV